jgi:predicted nucleotide-binding protein
MKLNIVYSDILNLADKIQAYLNSKNDDFDKSLNILKKVAEKFGESWSQSWIGYQSCIYYQDFRRPPQGAVFDPRFGFEPYRSINETRGDWVSYNFDDVIQCILEQANVDINNLNNIYREQQMDFDNFKSEFISIMSIFLKNNSDDTFVNAQNENAKKLIYYSRDDIIKAMAPHGTIMTGDTRAVTGGIQCPPHISILALIIALKTPYGASNDLFKIVKQVELHIKKLDKNFPVRQKTGTKVFIGHGKSKLWRELKDFIQDRMHLGWDEFNRVPIAGITNISRLSEMLNDAAIAFLVLTAEDEQIDGKLNPRMNVVHEAGLFQGRLGFEKAIVLLEHGCEEFSNINGLGQIRFPSGNIGASFEDIRLVLEREGLIDEK